jgi:hypothetical protein
MVPSLSRNTAQSWGFLTVDFGLIETDLFRNEDLIIYTSVGWVEPRSLEAKTDSGSIG